MFSFALGGKEGRQFFLLCNEFEGVDQLKAVRHGASPGPSGSS